MEPLIMADEDGLQERVEQAVEREVERTLPEGFRVHDAESAAWVVRRIVQARDYAERVKVWAEVERRRAEAEERRLVFLFGQQLHAWTEVEIAKVKGRRRSIPLPGGTVGFRAVPSRVVVRDEAVVMQWARKACPTAIITSERLVKTPITEHVERTGEVPEGVEIIAPRDEFYVR